MSSLECCLNKKQLHIIPLILLAVTIYIITSNTNPLQLLSMFRMECNDHEYPTTYYKKQWHNYNCTYNIYAIKVGEIYSQYLSHNEIKNLSHDISQHLLYLPDKMYHGPGSLEYRRRKQMFDKYYQNNPTTHCQSKQQTEGAYETDFFKFIQTNTKYTNNPNATSINLYNLRAINDSERISNAMNDYYHIPILYSYVLSVKKNGNLSSLELRFAQIVNKLQHDETKHAMLANNKRYILWGGEFYYIYDYKYKKYALIVDNDSGHWKPNQRDIPDYLEKILLQTLFPKYKNVSAKENSSYRPLIVVGFHQAPWVNFKKKLFPVIHEINHLYHVRHKGKRDFVHDMKKEIQKRSGKKIQKAGHAVKNAHKK